MMKKAAMNVLAVDRDASQALFSTLPPLRVFFERLIQDRMARWPPITGRPRSWPTIGRRSPASVG
jgi:hypothetical protein